ncbi:MAG: hypothetical protein RLZ98_391 [Pseudomonadota bacterium]|jgi:hypothetical protein
MLGFLAILGAVLAGLGGAPIWTIAVAAIALTSVSYAENFQLYKRGQELGLTSLINEVALRSFVNGLLAAGFGYAGGFLLRLL